MRKEITEILDEAARQLGALAAAKFVVVPSRVQPAGRSVSVTIALDEKDADIIRCLRETERKLELTLAKLEGHA